MEFVYKLIISYAVNSVNIRKKEPNNRDALYKTFKLT